MKVRVDKKDDALYVRLTDRPIAESEEVQPGVVLDFSAEGTVVGVEMLHISQRMSTEEINSFQFESA